MKPRLVFVAAGIGLVGVGCVVGLGALSNATAETFHVDYEHGRDVADGRTASTAWKHAPGDPKAKGEPARARLGAGDVVQFAANVRYRGTLTLTSSGTPQAPIVFTSAAPGGAIIDGSDPASFRPCRDAPDCGSAQNWQQLVRIEAGPVPKTEFTIFSDAGPLRPAQFPNPKDGFYRNETNDMLEVDGVEMGAGRVILPAVQATALRSGGGELALWVKPNLVVYRPIQSIQGNVARFDPAGLQVYTDRPARMALIGHVALLDQPGEYAVTPDGQAIIAMLPADIHSISIAVGRGGINLRRTSNVVVRGLSFENMADAGGLAPAGVSIFADQGDHLLIEGNRFSRHVMARGQGPIIVRKVSDLRILNNSIDTIELGSGMRLSGPAERIRVEDNVIRRIGRTGVLLMNVNNALVQRNTISDVRGVHGNGFSAYLANHDVQFIANTVLDAKQPATFHGSGPDAPLANNILFSNNLFVATPDSLGALISWGKNTRGVTIRNNVLIGGRFGLRLNAQDRDVSIADNIVSGLVVIGNLPPEWRLSGNAWTALSFQQRKLKPVPTVSGSLVKAADQLRQGTVGKNICEVVSGHSLSPSANASARVQIGAKLQCP